jgi:hypothetical protein
MSQISELPRPLLVAIVGAVAVAALLFATRKGGSDSASVPAQSTQSAAPSKAGSQTGTPAKPGSNAKPGGTQSGSQVATTHEGLPKAVSRAVAKDKVVVVLFWNPHGSDDRAVKESLAGVSTRNGAVAKFTDRLGNLSRYTRLTGKNVIAQTPAVLVVDGQHNGKAVTGLLDTESLDQLVVDALR